MSVATQVNHHCPFYGRKCYQCGYWNLRGGIVMYRPITMYQIVCDRCGEVFGGTDTCSALFDNKEIDIGDYSDWEMIDGKHYCPDCYDVEVINGVYNVKAK